MRVSTLQCSMDSKGSKDRDVAVDLEKGTADDDSVSGISPTKHLLNKFCNGLSGAQRSTRDGDATDLCSAFSASSGAPIDNNELLPGKQFGDEENVCFVEKKTDAEKPKKKKACKKPPKPPRPPRAASVDTTDQKLIQEITELAMVKRARIERMKALLKMKNAKTPSSNSNLFALIITMLFCLVIIWQGFCPRSHSKVSFVGSPESPVGIREQLISVQYLRKVLPGDPRGLSSSSPKQSQLDG